MGGLTEPADTPTSSAQGLLCDLPSSPAAAGLKPERCPAALSNTDKQMVFIYYYVTIIFLYCSQVPGECGTLAKRRKEKIIGYL